MKPVLQVHMGLWLIVTHCVFIPQLPGHGSIHFFRIQALSELHSELIVHSGLQLGGLLMYSGKQLHTACSLITRH